MLLSDGRGFVYRCRVFRGLSRASVAWRPEGLTPNRQAGWGDGASCRSANIKANSLSGAQLNEGSLSMVPSAGNADKVGGKGPGAFQAADHWALIAGSATGANILAQSGGLSVQRFSTGVYLVDVGASAAGKPLSATFNFASAGFVSVAPCGGSANNPGGVNCPVFNDTNHVVVITRGTGAAPAAADSSFYISIGG